ncbi:PREDICTED: F-box protein PP2-A12 isoform X3 [Populus euphratica]|uniref:F-box protein PP2-A12 isoform X3 n=1 Tax=Populus euphratica TaxID=75702 RepID=A0AAJ6XSB2_POPEU|nr:PREDICTED: F-box protein PP2-A12 isoform X3 [Populus euphratica]
MGANLSSSFADPNVYSLVGSLCLQPSPPPPRIKPGLGDLPESCVALVLEYLNPSEICRLAKLNRAFRGASWADFVWESKLPVNYEDLIERVFGDGLEDKLCKREVYTRLCRANTFDDGTKKAWLDKRTGGVCLSIASKGLAITGIDDRRYWNHIPTEESRLAGQVQIDPSIFLSNFFKELCLLNYELGGYIIGPSRVCVGGWLADNSKIQSSSFHLSPSHCFFTW